jgi:Na+-driven multidrug efflux pump
LTQLFRPGGRITIQRPDLRFDPRVAMNLVRVSSGGIAQYLIAGAAWIGLARVLATFGSVVLAGYVVAIRIVVFVILPAWGFSNAAATLVGQNLGARKPERAERAALLTGFWNMSFMLGVMVLFLFASGPIVRRFADDASVHATAIDALRIISYGYGFYAWGMVMSQAFNGAGDTNTPMLINLVCFWLFQIPMALWMSRIMGPSGVFWAIALAYSLSAVVGLAIFRRGRWKLRQV